MIAPTFFTPTLIPTESSCWRWRRVGRRSRRSVSRFLSHGGYPCCANFACSSKGRTLWERLPAAEQFKGLACCFSPSQAVLSSYRWELLGEDYPRCPLPGAMRSFYKIPRPVHTGTPKSDFPYREASAEKQENHCFFSRLAASRAGRIHGELNTPAAESLTPLTRRMTCIETKSNQTLSMLSEEVLERRPAFRLWHVGYRGALEAVRDSRGMRRGGKKQEEGWRAQDTAPIRSVAACSPNIQIFFVASTDARERESSTPSAQQASPFQPLPLTNFQLVQTLSRR